MFQFRFLVKETMHVTVTIVSTSGEAMRFFTIVQVYWRRNAELLDLKKKVGGGAAVAQWLRCCATNRKVAGSIAAGVI